MECHTWLRTTQKKLPDAVSLYGISELEMFSLLQNMKLFKTWLFGKRFKVIVDCSALPHILTAKKEPTTLHLKKYVELSEYSFDCRYQKGKDLQVANYLSCHNDNDVSEPSDITPISDVCNAITRRQAKTAGVKAPDIPWDKSDLLPEKGDQEFLELPQIDKKVVDSDSDAHTKVDPALPPKWSRARKRAVEPHWENRAHPLKLQGYKGKMWLMEPPRPDPGITNLIPESISAKDVPLTAPDGRILKQWPKLLLHQVAPKDILLDHLLHQSEIDQFVQKLKCTALHNYKLNLRQYQLTMEYSRTTDFGDIYKYIMHNICP